MLQPQAVRGIRSARHRHLAACQAGPGPAEDSRRKPLRFGSRYLSAAVRVGSFDGLWDRAATGTPGASAERGSADFAGGVRVTTPTA